jgi:hypothetical protein
MLENLSKNAAFKIFVVLMILSLLTVTAPAAPARAQDGCDPDDPGYVTVSNDDGSDDAPEGSLRWAMDAVCPGGTIYFDNPDPKILPLTTSICPPRYGWRRI